MWVTCSIHCLFVTGFILRISSLCNRLLSPTIMSSFIQLLADIPGVTWVFIYPNLLSEKGTHTHSYISIYIYTHTHTHTHTHNLIHTYRHVYQVWLKSLQAFQSYVCLVLSITEFCTDRRHRNIGTLLSRDTALEVGGSRT
jgi:hypothetical protein